MEGRHLCLVLSSGDQISPIFIVLHVLQVTFMSRNTSHGWWTLAFVSPSQKAETSFSLWDFIFYSLEEAPKDIYLHVSYGRIGSHGHPSLRKPPYVWLPVFYNQGQRCSGLVIGWIYSWQHSYTQAHNLSSNLFCHLLSQWFSTTAGPTSLNSMWKLVGTVLTVKD